MNRLADIEAALRDMRAAFDDEDWDTLAAVPWFEPDGGSERPVDTDQAAALLTKVNALLALLAQEARSVKDELIEQPTFRKAARAYLTSAASRT